MTDDLDLTVVESENESFIILHPLHRSSWDVFSPVEERFVFKIQSFVDHFSVARISLSLSLFFVYRIHGCNIR